jgi:hypothetical protein
METKIRNAVSKGNGQSAKELMNYRLIIIN